MLHQNFIIPQLHFSFFALPAFMLGIIIAYYKFPLHLICLVSSIAIIALLIAQHMRQSTAIGYLLIAVLLAGIYLCNSQQAKLHAFQQLVKDKTIDVCATINAIERITHPHFAYRMSLSLKKIRVHDQLTWRDCTDTVLIYLPTFPHLHIADTIELRNLHNKGVDNPSYNLYLAKENIALCFFTEKLNSSLLHRPTYSLKRALFAVQEYIIKTSRQSMRKETFALFCSIFLGNRTLIKKDMETKKELFKVWGVSHYLARSGLHLVIFIIIWHFILSLIPLSFFYKQMILMLLITIYALFSWSSISFERALYIFFIFKLCLLSNVPSHYVHLVALTTLILLVFNPLQLFFIDFQLSCGLTLALAWFNSMQSNKKRLSC